MLQRFVGVVVVLAACSNDDIVLGVIKFGIEAPIIEVPSSARLAQPFNVSVMTFGNACTSLERTDVEPTSDGVVIQPFDRVEKEPGQVCPQIRNEFLHEATVTFDTQGEKRIRFDGRTFENEVIQVPFTVVVE